MGLYGFVRTVLLTGAVVAGVAACDSGDGGVALPSTLPSITRTADRATSTPDATSTTTTAADTSPTRTRTATKPAESTTKPAESTTKPAEPTTKPAESTTRPAEPTTKPAEPTTNAPPRTTEATTPATTAAAPGTSSASPTPVAATTEDTSGMSTLGWLLLLLVVALAILVAVLLVNRSRRAAAWQTEAFDLAAAGRDLIATRLPQVLSTREPAARALAWPTVRAELTEMAARWVALAGRAADDFHRDSAGQLSIMAQDLVTAVDAENEALATGRDWHQLSPRVDQIVRTWDAALAGFLIPQPSPTTGGADPYPA
ncbi:hypothetical protein ACQP2F_26465 [Actinoplanes sp. CA-030573]|uniref:hypothetical protein n=1 Tax=Actinoplanes sp. CA-030573 TaxID=3239898 RepID=UPI003D90E199